MNVLELPEEVLQAHVDGRLDPAHAEAVAAVLAAHPDLAARVAAWRLQKASIADAYASLVDEPVPARLVQAASRPAAAASAAARLSALPWQTRFALAAMLAGGIAIGWVVRGALPTGGSGPEAAALPRDAAIAHAVYSPEIRHPVEVAASEQDHLVGWLSKRLGRKLVVPDLAAAGYELVGGRLLPGDQGPAAQFMYQDAAGRRLTLYVRAEPTTVPATAFRFTEQGALRVFHWVDGALGYALSGELDRDELLALATRVHRQIAS
jgi:anti-sigma factor RsiW